MKKLTVGSLMQDFKRDIREDIARTREQAARVNRDAIGMALKALQGITRGMKGLNVTAFVSRWDHGKLRATIRISVDSLKSDKTLRTLLSRCEFAGFESCESSDYVSDWCAERSFTYANSILKLTIEARVRDADKAEGCRRVQVGETVTITPKFEIVCD